MSHKYPLPPAGVSLLLAGAALLCAVPAARAANQLPPGELGLSYQTTASGTLGAGGTTQGGWPVSGQPTVVPASGATFAYADNFTAPTPEIGATGFGFYDDYGFTIGTSSADSVTTTINLGTQYQISDLAVRLYNVSAYNLFSNSGTPSFAPVAGEIDATPDGSAETISAVDLAAGTYVLEVRGDVTGTAGGSYSGVLNVIPTPVPLPGSLALLLSGIAAVGVLRLARPGAAPRVGRAEPA